jgi:hypothetical protein
VRRQMTGSVAGHDGVRLCQTRLARQDPKP